MTDRELLEMAAKAAGNGATFAAGNWFIPVDDAISLWNPLTDDGDALRLAVKLCIEVSPCDGVILVNFPIGPNRELQEIHLEIEGDRYATTRRAIVIAAAAVGESP